MQSAQCKTENPYEYCQPVNNTTQSVKQYIKAFCQSLRPSVALPDSLCPTVPLLFGLSTSKTNTMDYKPNEIVTQGFDVFINVHIVPFTERTKKRVRGTPTNQPTDTHTKKMHTPIDGLKYQRLNKKRTPGSQKQNQQRQNITQNNTNNQNNAPSHYKQNLKH